MPERRCHKCVIFERCLQVIGLGVANGMSSSLVASGFLARKKILVVRKSAWGLLPVTLIVCQYGSSQVADIDLNSLLLLKENILAMFCHY